MTRMGPDVVNDLFLLLRLHLNLTPKWIFYERDITFYFFTDIHIC